MKVFISYAHVDRFLAKKISSELVKNGFDVWNDETEILPGDDFGEKISNALNNSDAMVVLLTSESLDSKNVQWEIEYALGNKSYNKRLIPVLVGSDVPSAKIPWILQKLQMLRLTTTDQTKELINQITEVLREAA
jgi:hypothetical protein